MSISIIYLYLLYNLLSGAWVVPRPPIFIFCHPSPRKAFWICRPQISFHHIILILTFNIKPSKWDVLSNNQNDGKWNQTDICKFGF